jgi:RNA polymerase sigma-70 factor (ECF subfamily)
VKVEREVQDALHAEVCAGDPTASSRVFTVLLEPLIDWLGFRWRNERDAERVRDFAIDSILGYLEDPQRYDPSQASLLTYLRMDAHGDLLNDHERRQRRGKKEAEATVELAPGGRNSSTDEYPSEREPPEMNLSVVRDALPDERDRHAVLLMMEQERSTEAFAKVWELTELGAEEQAMEVKRNKDRIKARLRRLRKDQ